MFSIKCNIFLSIVLNYLKITQSLVERSPLIEENVIVKSEAIIRNTFNRLFYNLKLKNINEYIKFKEYSTIHTYFTSLALQDFDSLNKIVRIVIVNNKNGNKTRDFTGIINNAFELHQFAEHHKNKVTNNDESVITYILYFLKTLKKLKEIHSVDKAYLNINSNVLALLTKRGEKTNNSSIFYKSSDHDILDENDFWEPSARRIYKGDRTKIKHFPFIASIQIFNNFHCAGSIVKSDLIITASSCLQLAWNNRLFRENPAFLSARVGSSFYSGGGEVIPVLEIYFHPEYNPKTLKNNICVLRLIRHLNFRKRSKRIKKIDFDRHPSNIPMTTPGITILGWGAKQHSPVIGDPWKNVLSFAVLHVYPLKDCQDVYSREYVTRKNFCAGFFSRGGGACNRDVGGPGIVDGKLMGVISFGSPVCGAPDAPTVFTKLGYYADWIEEIMELDVPVAKKRTTLEPLHNPFSALPLYSTHKPTTFKIPPLTGEKMSPIPISIIDNQLRIFDENVFKDFLATMFHSEEITENNDVKDVEESIELESTINYGTKFYEEITEKSKPDTEFEDVLLKETKYDDTAVSLNNKENESVIYDIDTEIEKLIKNVNLEKIVKEEVRDTPTIVKNMTEVGDIITNGTHNSKNQSVLTLLYLSDEQKNLKVVPEDDIINDGRETDSNGMSIPVDKFEDLTRAKDNDLKMLPESDLVELLSEVIRQEIPNTEY